jgi:hypothetical protein
MQITKMELAETIQPRGYLSIRTGEAEITEYQTDANGNKTPSKWILHNAKALEAKENKICFAGWKFVKSKGWDVSLAIATGNGAVSGANAPSNTNTKLVNELTNGRYICPGDGDSRVRNNQVALYALWPRSQGTNTPITEWGLFCNTKGVPTVNRDSGLLISRIAYNFTRSSSTKDIEITWLITDNI